MCRTIYEYIVRASARLAPIKSSMINRNRKPTPDLPLFPSLLYGEYSILFDRSENKFHGGQFTEEPMHLVAAERPENGGTYCGSRFGLG